MKILIEPLLDGKLHAQTVQAKKFSLALRITNQDTAPSPAFIIQNIQFRSADNDSLINDCESQSFNVNVLNPNENLILHIGDYGYPSHGLISIELNVEGPVNPMLFCQKDYYSGKISELKTNNKWCDFWYVKSSTNHQQEKTNRIMLVLTIVLLFLAILQIIKLFEQELRDIFGFLKINNSSFFINVVSVVIALSASLLIKSKIFDRKK